MIEICCGSYEDALRATEGKADRIELNSALYLGGLTPSVASLRKVKQNSSLPVICMIRNRAAGFCYHKDEIEVMLADAEILLENGADGIAFGFLNEDRTINKNATAAMVSLIHGYQKEAVFHRAFDVTADWKDAMETLIALKVDRVLTSGQQPTAMQGKELIYQMQQQYGNQIEILAGSGVNDSNAKQLMEYTGVRQVHSSCKGYNCDPTTSGNGVNYRYNDTDSYETVQLDKVISLMNSI